ncbi:MAG: N-formylglutamate amidohydrolase [Pseudomonadota bacterium]
MNAALDVVCGVSIYGFVKPLAQTLSDLPVCPVAGLSAYTVQSAEGRVVPILFASPHSGASYPAAMLSGLRVPLMDLRRTEDAFVDELFAGVTTLGAQSISANYARAYVDLNRDARELDPDMFADGAPRTVAIPSARVEAGLGCLPKVAARGELIYSDRLSRAEGEYRLAQVHDAYHGFIKRTLEQFRDEYGVAVLIDCHSMPSSQPGRRKLTDIVLGDRFGSSCDSRLTGLAERSFRRLGYSVSRNAPYAGGFTTRAYGRPKQRIHALQIEINRRLYMDEVAVQKTSRFGIMQSHIQDVARGLTGYAKAKSC